MDCVDQYNNIIMSLERSRGYIAIMVGLMGMLEWRITLIRTVHVIFIWLLFCKRMWQLNPDVNLSVSNIY